MFAQARGALCLFAIFGSAACAIGGDEDFGSTGSETDYVRDGDMAFPLQGNELSAAAMAIHRPQTIYLNFDGVTIHKGGWALNNAQTNTSFIPGANTVTIPTFNASWWGTDRDAVIAEIADHLREDFAGYDVTVTTTRPSSGDYTMVVAGGSPADAAVTGAAGIAPVDANNWNSSDVVFVFTDEFRFYDTAGVAFAMAHEVGHSYGLNHIQPQDDIMNPVINFGALKWGEGPYPDNSGYQNDRDVLGAVLRDVTAPQHPCGGLASGEMIEATEYVMSCDGRFQLIQQLDGNLVLYQGTHAMWASNTWNTKGSRAIMQPDGNFVLYDTNNALWASGTNGHPGARLAVQNDGNVVVYGPNNGPALWASNTCCH